MFAIAMTLFLAALSVAFHLWLGLSSRKCWALTRNRVRTSPATEGYFELMVDISLRARIVQCVLFTLLAVAFGWALLPLVKLIGGESGALLLMSPIVPGIFQIYVLNTLARWAAEKSVTQLPARAIPRLKRRTVEPGQTYVVTRL